MVTPPDTAQRLQAVLDLVERHRQKWSLPMDARIVANCEAGQDAFWIYRALRTRGIECYVGSREHSRRTPEATRKDGSARCHQTGPQSPCMATRRARPHA